VRLGSTVRATPRPKLPCTPRTGVVPACTVRLEKPLPPSLADHACPTGQYCPEATSAPVNCPVGTYNTVTGRGALSDCVACDAGYYCLEASSNLTGVCDAGYYCLEGSTGPQSTLCPAGTYRSSTGGTGVLSCSNCTAGHYCPLATANPVDCPEGFHCGTSTVTPDPCPLGTYGDTMNRRDIEDCVDCLLGKFCDAYSRTYPTGLRDPGYYCIEGAYTSRPSSLPTGGLCPAGGYCPMDSSSPTVCIAGTYNSATGGSDQTDCFECKPGYYCWYFQPVPLTHPPRARLTLATTPLPNPRSRAAVALERTRRCLPMPSVTTVLSGSTARTRPAPRGLTVLSATTVRLAPTLRSAAPLACTLTRRTVGT